MMKSFLLALLLITGSATAQTTLRSAQLKPSLPADRPVRLKATRLSAALPSNPPARLKTTQIKVFDGTVKIALTDSSRVSAGIYSKTGKLLRTFLSGVVYPPGTHSIGWTGVDDAGTPLPDGAYDVRVLTNAVRYYWDGVIGNSSTSATGIEVHKAVAPMRSFVITGGYAYYTGGTTEGNVLLQKFATNNVQTRIPATTLVGSAAIEHAVTDGTNIYRSVRDAFGAAKGQHKYLVFATKVSDDTQVSFSGGASVDLYLDPTFSSGIALSTNANGRIGGLALSDSYLFVSRPALNQLQVFNKTTGVLVQDISLSEAASLAMQDDTLWVLAGTSVSAYPVNPDGTLGSVSRTLAGLSQPLAIAVSPDRGAIAVVDAGTSQQVKAFKTSDGSSLWTLGQAGGYATNPTVASDKFFFNTGGTADEWNYSFITFDPADGSFWFGDTQNRRSLHYSAGGQYLEELMFQSNAYACSVDKNNPIRVFQGNREFRVDYNKSLQPGNGSWRLVRNWMKAGMDEVTDVVTLSNGRTYGRLYNPSSGLTHIWELDTLTGARNTNIVIDKEERFDKLGNVWKLAITGTPSRQEWRKETLTGFNASNNPTYTAYSVVAQTTLIQNAYPRYGGAHYSPASSTESGLLVSFNGDASKDTQYHLGLFPPGGSDWKAVTAAPTWREYRGIFPPDGKFDVGNQMGTDHSYGGNLAHGIEKSVFWGYNGEFWKASFNGGQANMWNHVWENGLFVGQFGTHAAEVFGQTAAAGMAGNGFHSSIVKVNGKYYLFHGDESHHSALHRWRIENLESVKETVVPVQVQSQFLTYTGKVPGDLHEGLPFNQSLPSDTLGWTRFPQSDVLGSQSSNWIYFRTSYRNYNRDTSPDIHFWWRQSVPGTGWIQRDLGLSGPVTNWTIAGEVNWEGHAGNLAGGGLYIDVLDVDGKIIARHEWTITLSGDRPIVLLGNAGTIYSGLLGGTNGIGRSVLYKFQPLIISRSGTQVTFKYGPYNPITVNVKEAGADVSQPRYLRVYVTGNVNLDRKVGIMGFTLSTSN